MRSDRLSLVVGRDHGEADTIVGDKGDTEVDSAPVEDTSDISIWWCSKGRQCRGFSS